MIKIIKIIIFFILSISLMIAQFGCTKAGNNEGDYSLDQFVSDMKAKSYEFEVKDASRDFLPTERKRILVGNEAIEIYIYRSSRAMEKDSQRIDRDGSGYSNGFKSVKVSWISYPHFYKKGRIIVQYVGENQKIISDLKAILGEQFAGFNGQ